MYISLAKTVTWPFLTVRKVGYIAVPRKIEGFFFKKGKRNRNWKLGIQLKESAVGGKSLSGEEKTENCFEKNTKCQRYSSTLLFVSFILWHLDFEFNCKFWCGMRRQRNPICPKPFLYSQNSTHTHLPVSGLYV